jgi:Protein of unknown function (DUF3443)
MQGIGKSAANVMVRWHLVCITAFASMWLSGCGGGGGGGVETSNASLTRPAVFGSNSGTENSGIYVNDISSCPSRSNLQPNVVRVCVDDGPYSPQTGRQIGSGNRPFVTVRLCVPGSTTQCVDVDHMLVDTGSTGIRVAVSSLGAELKLPPATTAAGVPVAECMHFISGWAWGSLNKADVYVGGLVARNMPIQMMGNSSLNPSLGGNGAGAFPNVPKSCSAGVDFNNQPLGTREVGTIDAMRANGIIGLGVWPDDQLAIPDQYFVCPANNCVSISNLPSASYPRHLSPSFPSHSEGVALSLNAVGLNGSRNLEGSLVFGIPSLPIGAKRLALDSSGYFKTTLNGVQYAKGFIDSGSSGIFFDTNGSNLPLCTQLGDLYCPSNTVQLTATHSDITGRNHTLTFSIANAEQSITRSNRPNALSNIGGPISAPGFGSPAPLFMWGLPFFMGRTVYTVMLNTPLGGNYGLIAYTP